MKAKKKTMKRPKAPKTQKRRFADPVLASMRRRLGQAEAVSRGELRMEVHYIGKTRHVLYYRSKSELAKLLKAVAMMHGKKKGDRGEKRITH